MRPVWLCLVVAAVLSGCVKGPGTPYDVPDALHLVLDLEGDGAEGYLLASFDPSVDAGNGDSIALTGTTGALQNGVGYLQEDIPDGFPFPLRDEIRHDLYLNVSAPVRGTVYITHAVGSAAGAVVDQNRIRVELWVDGAFGGATEYDYTWLSSAQAEDAWLPVPIHFRPEVRQIPAGAGVEVRVVPMAGAMDLRLGTGGDHQSFLAMPVFTQDPLGSTLYLENGTLVRGQTPEGSDPESRGAPLLLLVGAGAVGLVCLASRGRRGPGLAVLMVLAVGFAGCAGGDGGATEDPDTASQTTFAPKVNQTQEESKDLEKTPELGAINGTVTDHLSVAVKDAHVGLLGTNHFTTSDARGAFRFARLEPGSYAMRVDAKGFDSLEEQIEVSAGKVTRVAIQLAPPSDRFGDQLAHRHDVWKGQDRVRIDERTIEPVLDGYAGGYTPDIEGGCVAHYGDSGSGAAGYHAGRYCDYPVYLSPGARILPGTVTVEVVLDWDTAGTAPDRLALQYETPAQPLGPANRYAPRGPGEPFMVQIFPDEADPGHQPFSNWVLYVEILGDDVQSPWASPVKDLGPVKVDVFAHKGVVPFEPAHQDLWKGRTSIHLVDGATKSFADMDGQLPNEDTAFRPDDLVPVGTDRIEGVLTWEASTLAPLDPPLIEYGLAYKPADVPQAHWREGLVDVEGSVEGNELHFTIEPEGDDLDQWYQTGTNWSFYVTAEGDDVTAYRGSVSFTLDAAAYKG